MKQEPGVNFSYENFCSAEPRLWPGQLTRLELLVQAEGTAVGNPELLDHTEQSSHGTDTRTV